MRSRSHPEASSVSGPATGGAAADAAAPTVGVDEAEAGATVDRGGPARRIAAGLIAAQGLLLVALGIFLVVRGFGHDATSRGRAEIGGVLAALAGVGLIMLARAALGRRQWARSPTFVCEFLVLPVSYGLLQGHRWGYGLPLAASALLAMVLLVVAEVRGGDGSVEDGPVDDHR